MTTSHTLPAINARDTAPQKPPKRKTITGRPARGNATAKYDHWQMLMDRLSGMTWDEVGRKHGIKAKDRRAITTITAHIALNSQAATKLSPEQAERMADLSRPGRKPEPSPQMARNVVVSNSMRWTIYSRNERTTVHNGRCFFAMRCNPQTPWVIDELNQIQISGSRVLQRLNGTHKTRELSAAITNFATKS